MMYSITFLACFTIPLLVPALSSDDNSQVFTKVAGSRNIGLDRWREYPKGDVWLSKLVAEQPEKRSVRYGGHSDSAWQRFNKKSGFYRFNRAGEEQENDDFEPDLDDWKRSGFYRFNKRSRREAEIAHQENPDLKRSGFYRFNKKSWGDADLDLEGNDKRNGFYRFNKRDEEDEDKKRDAFYRFQKSGYFPMDGQEVEEGNPLYRLLDPDDEDKRSGNWRFMKKNVDDEMDEDKRSGFYRFNREPILRGDLNPDNFNKKGKMPRLRFGEKRSFDRGELAAYMGEGNDDKRSGYWRFNKRTPDGGEEEFMKKSGRWRFAKKNDGEDDVDEDKRSGYWRFNKRNEDETDDKRSGYWRFNKRGDTEEDKRSGFYRFNKKNTADKYNARWTFGEEDEDEKRSGFYRFNKRPLGNDDDDDEDTKRSGFYRFHKKNSNTAGEPSKDDSTDIEDKPEEGKEE